MPQWKPCGRYRVVVILEGFYCIKFEFVSLFVAVKAQNVNFINIFDCSRILKPHLYIYIYIYIYIYRCVCMCVCVCVCVGITVH